MRQKKSLWAGALAGGIGGVAASWLMLRFVQGPGTRLLQVWKTGEDRERERRREAQNGPDNPDSVTMQAAETFSRPVIGRKLSSMQKRVGGTIVHYGFGAAMGAVYGMTAEFLPLVGIGAGVPFGTVLWVSADLLAVPAVGYAKWPKDEPLAAHATHWIAHVVYGSAMEVTRRIVRPQVELLKR